MDLGEIKPKHTLDETVQCLIDLRTKGIKATCEFNGQKLDSETVTMDSAYQAVMGCTKAEHDKQVEKMIQEREKENKDALDKIPQWIERGNKIIFPERQKDWAKCVERRAKGMYHGKDLEDALIIMESLDSNQDFKEAKKILSSQDHSGISFGIVSRILFEFSKKGPEFYEMIVPKMEIDKESQEIINQKKIENKILMEKYNRLEKTR